LLTILI